MELREKARVRFYEAAPPVTARALSPGEARVKTQALSRE